MLVASEKPLTVGKHIPLKSPHGVSFSQILSKGESQSTRESRSCWDPVGRGPQNLYLPVTEPQSKSSMILCNTTAKQTFDKVLWACNLLAILPDCKLLLVKSAWVSAERTMNKQALKTQVDPTFSTSWRYSGFQPCKQSRHTCGFRRGPWILPTTAG